MDSNNPLGSPFHGLTEFRGLEDFDVFAKPENPEDELISQRDGEEEVELSAGQEAEPLPSPPVAIPDHRGDSPVEPQLHLVRLFRGAIVARSG
jgi:hypothetical protein